MKKQELMLQEHLDLFKAIEGLEIQRHAIEEQEKVMREQLQKAMEEYGVLAIDFGRLGITYIEATERESLDTKAIKKDLPDIAELYMRKSPVKASVRIKVNDGSKSEAC